MTARQASAVLVLMFGVAGRPGSGAAQEPPRVTVRVRQVAGSTIYLDVGTVHGLATGDTIPAFVDSAGPPAGLFVVTASTEARSVLTFFGDPFPVARGDMLTLQLRREPAQAPPRGGQVPQRTADRPGSAARLRPQGRPRGRVALDLAALRSTTQVGGADAVGIERTFATPALRLAVTVPRAVGGFQFRTSMRLAYRYSGQDLISPATSTRVYALTLERDFTDVPLRIVAGRFASPVERYSGYWDGALIRIGRKRFGVGAIGGFEPSLWNERPSADLPKITGFADWEGRGNGWRWNGDVSAHTVRPQDGSSDHTYLGLSQRIWVGPVRLNQDVQVDRDPLDGAWKMSRLRVRASVGLSSNFDVQVGFSRREGFLLGSVGNFVAPNSRRVDAGFAVRGGTGFLAAGISLNEDGAGQQTKGATGTYSLHRLPGTRNLGTAGSVSWWSGPYGETLSAAPSLTMAMGAAWFQVGYRLTHSDYLDRTTTTHAGEVSLHAPFGNGMRFSVRSRVQWGGSLRSEGLNMSLTKTF